MSTPLDPETTTLAQAKQWLLERMEDGVECPACTQLAKVYRRKISSRQAKALIMVYRAAGRDWCHVPSVDARLSGDGGEISKTRYWGIVEESTERRDDGGRAGWWRITPEGERYVLGRLRVPQYVLIYDGEPLGLEGAPMGIRDALGTRFHYDELMAGR